MPPDLGRRRFISISAALCAGAVFPPASGRQMSLIRWSGIVLGAASSLELYHPDESRGRALVAACLDEVGRLERIFSLYRSESALSRLNRTGGLADPPPELRTVLRHSRHLSEISHGAFDVTVQPLWTLYQTHFAAPDPDPAGPSAALIDRARALVDYRRLAIADHLVRLERPGMGVTLNGIAQGFITDCVLDLLQRAGVRHVLAQLDAYGGRGRHPDGRPWHVGIADPRQPDRALMVVELTDRALATSGGYGTCFDQSGRFHHLFDTASGRPADYWAGTNVVAPSAMTADGLSTTLAVSPPAEAGRLLSEGGGAAAYLIDHASRVTGLPA